MAGGVGGGDRAGAGRLVQDRHHGPVDRFAGFVCNETVDTRGGDALGEGGGAERQSEHGDSRSEEVFQD